MGLDLHSHEKLDDRSPLPNFVLEENKSSLRKTKEFLTNLTAQFRRKLYFTSENYDIVATSSG